VNTKFIATNSRSANGDNLVSLKPQRASKTAKKTTPAQRTARK